MVLFYIVIFLLIIIGLQRRESTDLDAALEIGQTNVIKGISILLVFLSHIRPYIIESGYAFNGIEERLLSCFDFGQNIVIMFLFYSGYGIHQQLLKHGSEYVKTIPRHRVLNTLLNFDVAVFAFLILAIWVRIPLTLCKSLLAFTGWESLGNSNWYIFDILVLYCLVWLSHTLFKKPLWQWLAFAFLVIAFTFVMLLTRPFWWWDTILCFWGGYSLSYFKNKIQPFLEHHWSYMIIGGIIFWGLLHVCDVFCGNLYKAGIIRGCMTLPWLWLNLKHLVVATIIVILTMHVKCNSKPLEWCGRHLFPIYIYQRIPMLLLPGGFILSHHLFYIFSCLVITLFIANFYRFWQIRI